MTSRLPEPLQNDFDIVVIDLLSRYSVDNKSVRKFVQAVAQQVRDINRIPRILRSAKLSTGQNITQDKDDSSDTQKTDKPNFLTRLENLQNTFNKGGLLGVFFEYLKNKQADAKAKIVTPESDSSAENEVTVQQDNIPDLKSVEQNTEIIERTTTQLEKLQDAFDSKGLINIVQNIFNLLKNRSTEEPLSSTSESITSSTTPSVTTQSYTTDSQTSKTEALTIRPQSANYSTVNTTTTQPSDNRSLNTTNITGGESQAQSQNVIPDEISVILGGINDEGEEDLKRILKSVFEDIKPKEKRGVAADTTEEEPPAAAAGGGGFGALDLLGAGSLLKKGGGLLKKAFGGAKNLVTGAGRGIASLGRGALALGRMPVGTAVSGAGGLAGALGAGAAVAGGEVIGGQIGKSIISNEKFSEYWYGDKDAGKEAAEQFGTGIIGAAKATFALGSQMLENKKSEDEAKKREEFFKIKEIKLMEKVQQLGYKTKEEYVVARKAGIAPSLKWDTTKNEYYEINPTPTGSNDVNSEQRPMPITTPDTTLEQSSPLPVQSPEVAPLPADAVPLDVERPFVKIPEVGDAIINPDGGLLVSSPKEGSLFQLSKNDGIVAGPTTSLLPETTKINSSVPSSITENHIVNNSIDKKVLSDIASNTEKTNKSLAVLGDTILTLAKVFDSKTMNSGSSILINNNGQTQQYTSTSQIAESNVDTIRNVRQRFLAAISL